VSTVSPSPGVRIQPSAPKSGLRLERASDSNGEPLEIFTILPPNLESALAKGKVMVCFEGKWSKGRSPLNAVPFSTRFIVSQQDSALLDKIEKLADGATPGMLLLSAGAFAGLLPTLRGHPRVTLGKAQSVTISSQPYQLPIELTLQACGEI